MSIPFVEWRALVSHGVLSAGLRHYPTALHEALQLLTGNLASPHTERYGGRHRDRAEGEAEGKGDDLRAKPHLLEGHRAHQHQDRSLGNGG